MDALPPADRDIALSSSSIVVPTMTVYDNLAFLCVPAPAIPGARDQEAGDGSAEVLRIGHLWKKDGKSFPAANATGVHWPPIVRNRASILMTSRCPIWTQATGGAAASSCRDLQRTQAAHASLSPTTKFEALTMATALPCSTTANRADRTPEDIYDRPPTTFVAQLVGSPKITLLTAATENGTMTLQESEFISSPAKCATIRRICRRSSSSASVRGHPSGPSRPVCGRDRPGRAAGRGDFAHIKIGKQSLVSTVPGISAWRRGDTVRFGIVRERLHFFERVTGLRFSA